MPNTLSDKLRYLAGNLFWTWHPEIIGIFRDLDPELVDQHLELLGAGAVSPRSPITEVTRSLIGQIQLTR